MDCEQALSMLSARGDRELPADEAARLDEHLRDCPACKASAEAFELQHADLSVAFEPRRAAAALTAERVASRLKPMATRRPGGPVWLAAAAAVLLVAGISSWITWHLGRPPAVIPGPDDRQGERPVLAADSHRLTPRARPAATEVAKIAVGDTIHTKAGERRRVALPDGSVLYVNQNTTARLEADRTAAVEAGEVYVEVSPRNEQGPTFIVKTRDREVQARGTKFAVKADAAGTGVVVTQGEVVVAGGAKSVLVGAGSLVTAGVDTVAEKAPRASHLLDWTRDLMAAAESPLVPGSQYSGGALVAVDPNGQEAKLSLRKFHVDVHIEDGFARTTIDQTYFNHHPWRLEGTFYFPLPPDASLSRLAMYVDGKLMEGGMAERDYARRVYEQIVRSMRDPALLEWVDGSTFKMRVFPLEGRQEKRIVLSYTQRLGVLYGRETYRFPAGHSLQTVDRWSFHARVKNASNLAATCPSHPEVKIVRDKDDLVMDAKAERCKVDQDVWLEITPDRQVEAAAEVVRFAEAEHEGAKYLMLRYKPALRRDGIKQEPRGQGRHWIFLYESSADRDPLLARSQIEIVRQFLGQADYKDVFTVLTAATRVKHFREDAVAATPENVKSAVEFLEGTHLVGALDLGNALEIVSEIPADDREQYLIHLGSGHTAMGRQQDALMKYLPEGPRYVGVGVGKRWARAFMKQAAEKTGGYFTQINPDEPIAWRAFDLFATLATPRLVDLKVAADVLPGKTGPRFLTDASLLTEGEELFAVTRVEKDEKLPEAVRVTGSVGGVAFDRVLHVDKVAEGAGYLPRTWARLELDRLVAEDAAANRAKIVELSKAMYVMSPFTSLLVLESEEMYKEFKVDRGRKDHWAMYSCPETIPVVYQPDPNMPVDVRNLPRGSLPPARQVKDTVLRRSTVSESRESVYIPQSTLSADGSNLGDWGRFDSLSLAVRSEGFAESARLPEAIHDLDVLLSRNPTLGFIQDGEMFDGASNEFGLGMRVDGLKRKRTEADFRSFNGRHIAVTRTKWPDSQKADRGKNRWSEGEEFTPAGLEAGNGMVRLIPQVHFKRVGYTLTSGSMGTRRSIERLATFDAPDPQEPRGEMPARLAGRLLYHQPRFNHDERLFRDLVRHAGGLNTLPADIAAVIEAEAAPQLRNAPGSIDPVARNLVERARSAGWYKVTISAEAGDNRLSVLADGRGRFAWERSATLGLKEKVVCDGTTLLHLYPELGLGARRPMSRHHRAELVDLVPWFVPPAEDLARGADLVTVDDRTVAIAPHAARDARTDDGKPVPHRRLHLVFANGRLAERQVVEMPGGKVLGREVYDGKGEVRILDSDGKERLKRQYAVEAATEPDLNPDTKELVVLPMPLRSRHHVFSALNLDANLSLFEPRNGAVHCLATDDALRLLANLFAEGRADEALHVYRLCFESNDDRRPGFFALLASTGVDVTTQPAFQRALSERPREPVLLYLGLHTGRLGPGLRRVLPLAVATARVGTDGSFLQQLATFHDRVLRGESPRTWLDRVVRDDDFRRVLRAVEAEPTSPVSQALLSHLQAHSGGYTRRHNALADAWHKVAAACADDPTAVYEEARCRYYGGRRVEARTLFLAWHKRQLERGYFPAVDSTFRDCLAGDGKGPDGWGELIRATAARWVQEDRRGLVVALAGQARELNDGPLADHLLGVALDGVGADDRLAVTLGVVAHLRSANNLSRADELLRGLLGEEKYAADSALWRLASSLAASRGQTARATESLEKALELEYRDLPEVIDLEGWRQDYQGLLGRYADVARSAALLGQEPPAGLAARVVRATDRWRTHDPETGPPCEKAGEILAKLGQPDLAWDYLTTSAAGRGNSSSTWTDLAGRLERAAHHDLADHSFRAAAAVDPNDPRILWGQASNLRQAGQAGDADGLLRQIEGREWKDHPGFRERARWELQRR